MKFISLFAGIGGMDLGLERAGMQCITQVEIDDYATKVLTKHWPHVPKFRDVRDVGAHNLPYADLICGGFPCQDISGAGKRAGLSGERSGLWSEFYRIICELRPEYVLVENVAALLVPVRRAGRIIEPAPISRVLGDLASCGYDCEWDCIPAAAVGAPHQRDRVFIVGYSQCFRREKGRDDYGRNDRDVSGSTSKYANSLANPSIARSGRLPVQQGQSQQEGTDIEWGRENVAHSNGQRCRQVEQSIFGGAQAQRAANTLEYSRSSRGWGWWQTEPDVGRVAHGVPARLDRLRGVGNAVVPQVAQFVGGLIIEHARSRAV